MRIDVCILRWNKSRSIGSTWQGLVHTKITLKDLPLYYTRERGLFPHSISLLIALYFLAAIKNYLCPSSNKGGVTTHPILFLGRHERPCVLLFEAMAIPSCQAHKLIQRPPHSPAFPFSHLHSAALDQAPWAHGECVFIDVFISQWGWGGTPPWKDWMDQ